MLIPSIYRKVFAAVSLMRIEGRGQIAEDRKALWEVRATECGCHTLDGKVFAAVSLKRVEDRGQIAENRSDLWKVRVAECGCHTLDEKVFAARMLSE